MAAKIDRAALPPAPAADTTADDLAVLHPERTVVLAGRTVTVREYGHLEWLRLLGAAEPLVAAIAAHLATGREPSYEDALAVLAQHADALAPLVAQAAGIDVATFEGMRPDDGELLLMTWWGCNGGFFVQRALNRVAVARAEAQRATSAGARSTPPSQPTGMTQPG